MQIKQVVLCVLWFPICCYCASTRIWHFGNSCGRHGFTCLPKARNAKTLIYECPSKIREYHIYINEFNGPSTIENIIIRNCKTLTIIPRCTKYVWEKKNLKYLEISNIDNLKFQNWSKFQNVLPPTVVLRNIRNIKKIPKFTFTKTNKNLNEVRCILPKFEFNSLQFHNVSIDTLESEALFLNNNFGNITFKNSRILQLKSSSVITDNKIDEFLFEETTVEELDTAAFQVEAQKVIFSKNKFREMPPNGIKVTSNIFEFTGNNVSSAHAHALSVASEYVIVSSNHFQYLKTGAFSKIGDLTSQISTYVFTSNTMNFLENDSLSPNLDTYRNVSSQITFRKNIFNCQCQKMGFLLSNIGKIHNDQAKDAFYQEIFDERSENVCISPCSLSVSAAKPLITDGLCMEDITVSTICETKNKCVSEQIPSSTVREPITFSSRYPKLSTISSRGSPSSMYLIKNNTLNYTQSTKNFDSTSEPTKDLPATYETALTYSVTEFFSNEPKLEDTIYVPPTVIDIKSTKDLHQKDVSTETSITTKSVAFKYNPTDSDTKPPNKLKNSEASTLSFIPFNIDEVSPVPATSKLKLDWRTSEYDSTVQNISPTSQLILQSEESPESYSTLSVIENAKTTLEQESEARPTTLVLPSTRHNLTSASTTATKILPPKHRHVTPTETIEKNEFKAAYGGYNVTTVPRKLETASNNKFIVKTSGTQRTVEDIYKMFLMSSLVIVIFSYLMN